MGSVGGWGFWVGVSLFMGFDGLILWWCEVVDGVVWWNKVVRWWQEGLLTEEREGWADEDEDEILCASL